MAASLGDGPEIPSPGAAARHKGPAIRPGGVPPRGPRHKNRAFDKRSPPVNRRHDIDALRALAFALVILYHGDMYYVAGWDWHLKSPHAAEWLQTPMRALNLWRMDLVFLVSGLAVGLLRRGQTPDRLLGQRSLRLLLPLAFGMAVVVPF